MSTAAAPRHKTVILDRDGTLNRERSFITCVEQLEVLPGIPAALQRLADAGYLLVVVTNQSGIARGLYRPADLARIHAALHHQLHRLPRAYLHCPHHPDQGAEGTGYNHPCHCRKPSAGMLAQADRLFGIDWRNSYLIGDTARDLLMGCDLPATRILVRSGKPWREQALSLEQAACPPHQIVDDLVAATDFILA